MNKAKQLYKKFRRWISKAIPYLEINLNQSFAVIDKNSPIIELTAVGDVTLAYRFDNAVKKNKLFDPFVNVKALFGSSSITLANLESPITSSEDKLSNKKFNFKSNPSYVTYLKNANIDIVNLANNHIGDYGKTGIIETVEILRKNNILYFGAGIDSKEARSPIVVIKDNIKIAFLGYDDTCLQFLADSITPGVAFINDEFTKEIRVAKKDADIVCVNIHFGSESCEKPTDRQKVIAKTAIDNGADIVLGHHPHVIQGFSRYKQGFIFYSLGNFCFGGNANPSDKDTFIASITIQKTGIKNITIIPCKISSKDNINDFTPIILDGNERKRILWKIKKRNRYT